MATQICPAIRATGGMMKTTCGNTNLVKATANLKRGYRLNNTTKDTHMLNEHDLADFERLPVEKLYNLPRESYFEFDNVPYYFDHVDGMYSLCIGIAAGFEGIIHFSASTPVVPLKAPK